MCVLQTAYLFSPLLIATALSALALRFDLWRVLYRPIDGGRTWRGIRWFGDHKTWRGFLVVVVGCSLGVAIQTLLGDRVGSVAVVDYEHRSNLLLGPAMGIGAAIGELPNSFVKRRVGVAPGATATGWRSAVFYVWDQIDLLVGAWPLVALWIAPTPCLVLSSLLLVGLGHPLISAIGFLIGARTTAR